MLPCILEMPGRLVRVKGILLCHDAESRLCDVLSASMSEKTSGLFPHIKDRGAASAPDLQEQAVFLLIRDRCFCFLCVSFAVLQKTTLTRFLRENKLHPDGWFMPAIMILPNDPDCPDYHDIERMNFLEKTPDWQ